MAILHTINGETFNKKQLVSYVRNSLKTLGMLDGMKYEVAWYLLQRRGKICTDRPSMKVDTLLHQYGKDNCYFYDDDGKWEWFSYIKAIATPPQVLKHNIFSALRYSVQSDSLCFRTKNQQFSNQHVDHIIPFNQILDDFLKIENLYLFDISVIENKNEKIGYKLKDEQLDQRWKTYHNKVAIFQLLDASDNLCKGGVRLQRISA